MVLMQSSNMYHNQQAVKAFENRVADYLREEQGITDSVVVQAFSHAFASAISNYQFQVKQDSELHKVVNGEVVWTEKRSQVNQQLMQAMRYCFNRLEPYEKESAEKKSWGFWSGKGKAMALHAGRALEGTKFGQLMEHFNHDINDTFFKGAYQDGHEAATAGNIGLWEAVSLNYASEVEGDAHVYWIDASPSWQSVFMNDELPMLRLLQAEGQVKDIVIHRLKPEALVCYQILENEYLSQMSNSSSESSSQQHLKAQMNDLLAKGDNWTAETFGPNTHIQLKMGLGDHQKTVSLNSMMTFAKRMKDIAHLLVEAKGEAKHSHYYPQVQKPFRFFQQVVDKKVLATMRAGQKQAAHPEETPNPSKPSASS